MKIQGGIMEYEEFVNDITSLDFIKDEKTADAAIKAVLGILSSSLNEEDTNLITSALPEPLDTSTLRKHQSRSTPVSFEECVTQIALEFEMDEERAKLLTEAILRSTRAALGGDKLGEVEEILPASWRDAIENA